MKSLRPILTLLPLLAFPLLAATPASQPAPFSTSLTDTACALKLMEVALRDHPLTDDNAAAINRQFDHVVSEYFSGGLTPVLQGMHAIELSVSHQDTDIQRTLASLSVHMDHPINIIGQPLTATFGQLYTPDHPAALTEVTIQLTNRAPFRRFSIEATLPFAPNLAPKPFTLDTKGQIPPGRYIILARSGTTYRVIGATNIVDQSLDALRKTLTARIDALHPTTPDQVHAVAVCRSRIALLTDTPNESQFINLITDFAKLSADLATEVTAIEKSQNPYLRHEGDLWCLLDGRIKTPLRIYAPTQACKDTPVPLIIALHGLGGDENLFMDSYGAGEIKTLADQHGCLVVSPLTYAVLRDPTALTRIIDHLSHDYAIDPQRIYVIGHSLGTSPALNFALHHHDTIAAAALISGLGGPDTKQPMSPTLVISGDDDTIVPPKITRDAAAAAQAAGLPVETRELPHYGHMFTVEKSLPQVVTWLLTHKLP